MKRRAFLKIVAGAPALWFAGAAAVSAQSQRPRRVGLIMAYPQGDRETQVRVKALLAGLRELGWADNISVDVYPAFGDMADIRRVVEQLVRDAPDIVVTSGTPITIAVQAATKTIPIVFSNVADPVESGLVASLSRPGGNTTGFSNYEPAISGKWLEVLRELTPSINRVLLLYSPDNVGNIRLLKSFGDAASALKMSLTAAPVREAADIKKAIDDFARTGPGCLAVLPGRTASLRNVFLPLALEHRLPAIYPFPYIVHEGGMLSYGIDPVDVIRQTASYVDRILRGANPGELPVQNPTKLELVVNLKTAKAIGLAIPESFLLRANEVIE